MKMWQIFFYLFQVVNNLNENVTNIFLFPKYSKFKFKVQKYFIISSEKFTRGASK